MNQTRTLLIAAWMFVAALLWMAWTKEQVPAPAATPATASTAVAASSTSVPSVPSAPSADAASPTAPTPPTTASAMPAAPLVTVTTDVLRLRLDGGASHSADILQCPLPIAPGSAPMRLFDDSPEHLFVAQSGWVSSNGPAPSHEGAFVPVDAARAVTLAAGTDAVQVPFVWHGPNGISIRRTYTFRRGDYVIDVHDEVINQSTAPWQGYVYRQLVRVPPTVASGMMHPESYSFHGVAWYSDKDKLEKLKFTKFGEDTLPSRQVTGGWIAMLQHHFFTAWIPGAKDTTTFSTAVPQPGQALVRELGPAISVAPGATETTQARLWVGPKLVKQIAAQHVPGLERAVDFSSITLMAVLAGWLFWVLQHLHELLGNWGWSIVGLVVLIKLALFRLSAAKYK
jgi:YidC/Oxa1 family membrane protein insertase